MCFDFIFIYRYFEWALGRWGFDSFEEGYVFYSFRGWELEVIDVFGIGFRYFVLGSRGLD